MGLTTTPGQAALVSLHGEQHLQSLSAQTVSFSSLLLQCNLKTVLPLWLDHHLGFQFKYAIDQICNECSTW